MYYNTGDHSRGRKDRHDELHDSTELEAERILSEIATKMSKLDVLTSKSRTKLKTKKI